MLVRGAGQGDVGSPINWDALFDILLVARSSVKKINFYTHGSSDILYPIPDIADADDLLSAMSSLDGIQEKAKIISAFAIIFGLDIEKSKQRPIMLVEVVRKTWFDLIIHRINASWNKHDILHSSQHGFR